MLVKWHIPTVFLRGSLALSFPKYLRKCANSSGLLILNWNCSLQKKILFFYYIFYFIFCYSVWRKYGDRQIPPRKIPPGRFHPGCFPPENSTPTKHGFAKYAVDANLLSPEFSILTRAKRTTSRNNAATSRKNIRFYREGTSPWGNIPGWNVPGGSIPRT